jgi:hypothetical protein
VLSQGSLLEKPWHFLFFDTGEKEDFQTEIRDIFAARPLRSSPPDSSGGSYTKEFAMENGRQLICSLSADSMDNGYLRCSVVVVGIRGTGSETLFGKDLYCRQGEWIALTGFSRSPFLKADATPPGTRHDLILLFKPSIRVSN